MDSTAKAPREHANGPFAAPWYSSPQGNFVGALLVVILFGAYWFFQVAPLIDRSHQNDFKHLYVGSRLLAEGLSPYEANNMFALSSEYALTVDPRFRTILPYVYLPFTGMVLYPVMPLPFAKAMIAFQAINHLCLILGTLVLLVGCRWRENAWHAALLVAMLAFNIVVYRQNNAGQLNAILMFGYALLFYAISRRWHDSLIGLIAAFLMLLKLSPGIILIWFLLRREWSRAAWMAGMAVGLTLVSCAAFGFERQWEFVPILSQMGYGKSTWAEYGNTFWRDPYNQSFNALFHRLFVAKEGSGFVPWFGLSATMANAFTWIVSLGILGCFGWCVYTAKPTNESFPAASFALAVTASLLLPSILWDHYLVQLLVPIVLLYTVAKGPVSKAALLFALILTCIPINFGNESYRSGAGILVENLKLLPVLICFAVGVCLTRK